MSHGVLSLVLYLAVEAISMQGSAVQLKLSDPSKFGSVESLNHILPHTTTLCFKETIFEWRLSSEYLYWVLV